MPLRSILLRVLFWSLAAAACFGALGVLFARHDTIWRVAGTAISTSIAALLLLGVSVKLDKPASRAAALLAFVLIVAEYLLSLAAIWEVGRLWGATRAEESLWLTVLFVALTGLPAIVFMRLTGVKLTALAGRVGLALAAAELGLLLVLAWRLYGWSVTSVAENLAAALPGFAILVFASLVGAGMPPARHWRWLGVAAAAAGYALVAYQSYHHIGRFAEEVVYLVCIAAAVAHANIVLLCELPPAQMWLRWITLTAGASTALFVALSAHFNAERDLLNRLAGACAIVGGCGTLALVVLTRINRRAVIAPDAMVGLSQITVFCPLCRKRQTIPLGGGSCNDCHVLINVRVEEPRCRVCGYSLLMLPSNVCPECGTPVLEG